MPKKFSNSFFLNLLKQIRPEIKAISQYVSINEKIKVKNKKCGHVYEMTPNKLLYRKDGCPECTPNKKRTHQDFLNLLKDEKEYEVLSNYTECHSKVLILHNVCCFSWEITPNHFIQGVRCPRCSRIKYNKKSNGVKKLIKLFSQLNLRYEEEKIFSNFKNSSNYHYPYDFFIPSLNLLIEFDGEQHFKEKNKGYFKTKYFSQLKTNDKIKNNYVRQNNLNLIRISYKTLKKIDLNILNEILINSKLDEGSSTIEKYNIFLISNGKNKYCKKYYLFHNKKYYIE
jgi:very-short-patch-repair endonuclease